MPHPNSLIVTLVAGLGLAFVFGVIANRIRLSPLVGYLLAGVVLGPFTPGYVADQALAPQLAEVGVILLMFGVGLHFSLDDLLEVRRIAVPGALGQIAVTTLLGFGLARLFGWSAGAGIVFGLALSVASTVVVLRNLQERRLVETERGKIAVGWLIVEDLAMVIVLVVLPAIAGLFGGEAPKPHGGGPLAWLEPHSVWAALGLTFVKVTAFVAGNALVVFAIVAAFRYSLRTALTLAASLSQIGEFSFILAGLGVALKLLPETGRDLILAGALLSILANPLLFVLVDRLGPWLMERERRRPLPIRAEQAAQAATTTTPELPATSLSGHAVLVGYGRVGRLGREMLQAQGQPLLVIEERQEVVDRLRARGIEAISGNAGQPGLLEAANIAAARWLISAIPNPFENGNLVEHGRVANPGLEIIARAHSDAEVDYLKQYGADFIIVGEREIARGMAEHIESRLERDSDRG